MTLASDAAELTAVEVFSRAHDAGELPIAVQSFVTLVPATPPAPGQQYGFEVDLDACTGCKSCVVACHNLNGLDDGESWRTVGLLRSREGKIALQQPVTTSCHHCVEPACLKGCPVDAYDKDLVTGIVTHLDDQCIGCGYCTWTCPYEVPQFNKQKGIVRKCDMCRGRLEAGEAPACVQACPNEAIRISLVDVTSTRAAALTSGAALVPGAPQSRQTIPTTTYRSSRPDVAALVAADRDSVRPAHAHPPLALMLVLTQVAAGAVAVDTVLRLLHATVGAATSSLAAAMGALALAVSVGHLGRPRYALRAVLGIGHSWLSREVVAFGAFGALALAAAALRAMELSAVPVGTADFVGMLACAAGLAGVGCSVMVYAVCGRRWWSLGATTRRFTLTAASCGLAITLTVALVSSGPTPAALGVVTLVALLAKLASDAAALIPRSVPELARTRALLVGELAARTRWRFALGVASCGMVGVALAVDGASATRAGLALAATILFVAGELVERSLFFSAEAGPRMPGSRP